MYNSAKIIERDTVRKENKMAQTVDEIAELINNLRDENDRNSENFEKVLTNINAKLEEMSDGDNIETLRLYFSELKKSIEEKCTNALLKFEDVQKIFSHILAFQDELAKGEEIKLLFSNFNSIFEKFLLEMQNRKEILENIERQLENAVTKNDIENLANSVNDIKESFENNSKMNYENLINEINNLKLEIISNINTSDNNEELEKINSSLNDLITNVHFLMDLSSQNNSELLDSVSSETELILSKFIDDISANSEMNFGVIKNSVESINSEVKQLKKDIMDSDNARTFVISNGFNNLKSSFDNMPNLFGSVQNNILNVAGEQLKGVVESVKEYIKEAQQVSLDNREIKYAGLVQKLSDIETLLTQSAQDYEFKSENLQSKLSEFVQIVENSSADTEGKISASLDELKMLKEELLSLNESLKAEKIANDEKSNESISIIDAGIENIILTLNNVSDEIKRGSEKSVGCLIENSDKKLSQIKELLFELKDRDNSVETIDKISESVESISSELRLVSTDILDALRNKSDDMIRAFNSIKESLDLFTGFDVEQILETIKSQLEDSFSNFSMNVNKDMLSYSESFSNLEQAYKNSLNKISVIEECVTDKIQSDLELMNLTIEKNISGLKSSITDTIGVQVQDIQESVNSIMDDKKIFEALDNIKNNFQERFDLFNNNQNLVSSKQDEIQDDINKLFDNIKSFVNIATQKVIDNTNSDKVITKIEELKSDNLAIADSINNLNTKLDVIVADSTAEEMHQRFDEIGDANNQINDKISALNTKINIMATDTASDDIKSKLDKISEKSEKMMSDYFNNLNAKIDTIVSDESIGLALNELTDSEKEISNIVQSINTKVDAIAADTSLESLLDEIDNVKNIIYEQHKNFETSSDDRLSAIDTYLKDVLVKLDNVDLDKNAEDIKESVMNALISVVDQISFVEESEEIKDFVEEKTDEINKNIIEVQNQLKQLSTSDDAFDYTYTLQDVESDIAKLRIAINNLQSADYSDLSYEIKKIVNAVDGLEASLTQDEMIDLKANIESLTEDILSISVRTNRILLNSDESFKTLTDGLNNFSGIIYKLEDRINNLDTNEATSRIENKLDRVHSMAVASANADKVFHQALMYLGEWVDLTTENISSISDKTARINDLEKNIEDIKSNLPLKDDILNEIKELLPDNQDLISRLVSKFQLQEERIDILENKLEKILSTIEEKDDTVLNRKVDKIEKMLSKLGTNIEKLTSYVDEE